MMRMEGGMFVLDVEYMMDEMEVEVDHVETDTAEGFQRQP